MKKESSVRQTYAKLDLKSPEIVRDKGRSAEEYRTWVVSNFPDIGEEALIALFGCRGFHEIKAEWELSNIPAEEAVLESNIVEKEEPVRQPKFDKKAYQAEYMKNKRAKDKAARAEKNK